MSNLSALIELCKGKSIAPLSTLHQLTDSANVFFLNPGKSFEASDLTLITWRETDALYAGLITRRSRTIQDLVGFGPIIHLYALGSTNLNPHTICSHEDIIKDAVDDMLRSLQRRVGQFAPALRDMPNQRMVVHHPYLYGHPPEISHHDIFAVSVGNSTTTCVPTNQKPGCTA